jgi:CRISPR/Cas system-associated endoribonuclease Cas2
MMASSSDYEKLWDNYQNIVKTKNESIIDYFFRKVLLLTVMRPGVELK